MGNIDAYYLIVDEISYLIYLIFGLRFLFFHLFLLELHFCRFNKKRNKYIWIVTVIVLGHIGYFMFVAYKRKFITRREFKAKPD